jgi:FkbM family methyltransferase
MNYLLDYLKLTLLKAFNINSKKVRLAGFTVYFGSVSQLKLLFKEIFVRENYKFDSSSTPYIIDGGANIGLAVLYFKNQFPEARVVAFEPNPESFKCLKLNVETNQIKGVEIHNAALSSTAGMISFYSSSDMEKADIGASTVKNHVAHHHGKKGELIENKVESKILSPFIDKQVDLLKLDIEGSEGCVFNEIRDKFHQIKHSIMEYHYHFGDDKNLLSDIISTMEKNDHAYTISLIAKTDEVKSVNGYMIKSTKMSLTAS